MRSAPPASLAVTTPPARPVPAEPITAAPPRPPLSSDAEIDAMVMALTLLAFEQPATTLAVGAGKLASNAAWTYAGIIGAKLLVSRDLRLQDAGITIGMGALGGLLQLLENRWMYGVEVSFQNRIIPWLAPRCASPNAATVAHYAATLQSLDSLAHTQAWRLVGVAGVLGSMASSVYAAFRGSNDQVAMPLFGVMLGLSIARQGLDAWWVQRNQQLNTDLALERSRAKFALVKKVSTTGEGQLEGEIAALESNRQRRFALGRANIGVDAAQDIVAYVGYYAVMHSLGWFDPQQTSIEQLVGMQSAMTMAQSLVRSVMTLPSYAVEQMQMQTQVRAYLQAQAPDDDSATT